MYINISGCELLEGQGSALLIFVFPDLCVMHGFVALTVLLFLTLVGQCDCFRRLQYNSAAGQYL